MGQFELLSWFSSSSTRSAIVRTRSVTPACIVDMLARYGLLPRSVNVDTPEKPKRRWWRKKRWAGALALLLALSYPASEGPARYASSRGWIPYTPGPLGVFERAYVAAYRPLDAAERWVPGLWTFRWQWKQYWETLSMRHSSPD